MANTKYLCIQLFSTLKCTTSPTPHYLSIFVPQPNIKLLPCVRTCVLISSLPFYPFLSSLSLQLFPQLSLQQGANGLLLRVQPYLHLSDAGVFDLTQPGDDSQPWADTLENLSAGEQVLSKMMEVLSGTTEGTASPTNKWMAAALDEEEEDEMSVESRSIGTIGEVPSYAFNVRIKVRILIDVIVNDVMILYFLFYF